MFYAQNSLFVFDGFYNMGQNGFLFFAEFFNSPFVLRSPFKVRPSASSSSISPAPGHARRRPTAARACPPEIDSRQGLPCLLHMGIPQWAYYTNTHTNYYLYFKGIILPITIDKYPNGHYNRPIQDEGAPGNNAEAAK